MPKLPNMSEIMSTIRGYTPQPLRTSIDEVMENARQRNLHNYSPEAGGVSDSIALPSGGKMLLYITRPHAPGFEGGHPEVSWELDAATQSAVERGALNRRTVARESIQAVSRKIREHAARHGISAYTFQPISQSRRRLNRGMAERDMPGYEYIAADQRTDRPLDPFTGKPEASIQDILVQSPNLMQDIALALAGTAIPGGALALALTEQGQTFFRGGDRNEPREPDDFFKQGPR